MLTCSPCPANSMNIVHNSEGCMIIDNVRNRVNVDASCRYVGANKDVNLAFSQTSECSFSPVLRL